LPPKKKHTANLFNHQFHDEKKGKIKINWTYREEKEWKKWEFSHETPIIIWCSVFQVFLCVISIYSCMPMNFFLPLYISPHLFILMWFSCVSFIYFSYAVFFFEMHHVSKFTIHSCQAVLFVNENQGYNEVVAMSVFEVNCWKIVHVFQIFHLFVLLTWHSL
jgi:hypothetical protein